MVPDRNSLWVATKIQRAAGTAVGVIRHSIARNTTTRLSVYHYEEERRVFYVALTRAEKELHLVTQSGAVSRYVGSITSLEVIDDEVTTIEGKITELNRQTTGSRPHKITVDCGSYDAHLLTWEESLIAEIEKDGIYRFDDLAYQPNRYDEDLEITEESTIRRVQ